MKVLIVGGGQVGSYVANLLNESDVEGIVIENRKAILEKLRNEYPTAKIIEGDGSDPQVLLDAGIQDSDVVAAVTGKDEVNLVVSTIAKYEFGVDRVIARVNHPRNSWLFTLEMGVDVKVNQAELLAHLIVEEIDLKNMLTLMKLNHGIYSIVQIKVSDTSKAINTAIKDVEMPDNVVLIAIDRNHEMLIPRGDTIIEEHDFVLAFADEQGQEELYRLLG